MLHSLIKRFTKFTLKVRNFYVYSYAIFNEVYLTVFRCLNCDPFLSSILGTASCLYFLNFVYNGKLVEQRLNAR